MDYIKKRDMKDIQNLRIIEESVKQIGKMMGAESKDYQEIKALVGTSLQASRAIQEVPYNILCVALNERLSQHVDEMIAGKSEADECVINLAMMIAIEVKGTYIPALK